MIYCWNGEYFAALCWKRPILQLPFNNFTPPAEFHQSGSNLFTICLSTSSILRSHKPRFSIGLSLSTVSVGGWELISSKYRPSQPPATCNWGLIGKRDHHDLWFTFLFLTLMDHIQRIDFYLVINIRAFYSLQQQTRCNFFSHKSIFQTEYQLYDSKL